MRKLNMYLIKQWAAVSTQFLWIRVPPQVWENVGSGWLVGQTWNKQRRNSLNRMMMMIKCDEQHWVQICTVNQKINTGYRKGHWYHIVRKLWLHRLCTREAFRCRLFSSFCEFSSLAHGDSHLHGHLPGPGVRCGWLSIHNTWHNSRRNGWFPTCAWPVWKGKHPHVQSLSRNDLFVHCTGYTNKSVPV